MFSLRNKKNYLWIVLSTPSYLELCRMYLVRIISSPVWMYKKSYCTTLGVGIGVGSISKTWKILPWSFYVMSMALTGELSCPVADLVLMLHFSLTFRFEFETSVTSINKQDSDAVSPLKEEKSIWNMCPLSENAKKLMLIATILQ